MPPFQIHLLNGSPRVRGNKVFIEFSTNKPASSKCLFDGVVIPCKLLSDNSTFYFDVFTKNCTIKVDYIIKIILRGERFFNSLNS